jgi:hypothetical protein
MARARATAPFFLDDRWVFSLNAFSDVQVSYDAVYMVI